jgi:hypothetical protein
MNPEMQNNMTTKNIILRTLRGESVVVGGIGIIDGFIQLAIHDPDVGNRTKFLYEMKLDTPLFEYLKSTTFFWEDKIFKTVKQK